MRWEPIWTRTQFAWDRNSSATSYEASITHKQVPTRRRDGQRYQQKIKKKPGQAKTFKHKLCAIYKV